MAVEPIDSVTQLREIADLLEKCPWFEPSYGSEEISDFFHGPQNELNQAALDVARKLADAGATVRAEVIHDGTFFRVSGRTKNGGRLNWLTKTGDPAVWRVLTKQINRRRQEQETPND